MALMNFCSCLCVYLYNGGLGFKDDKSKLFFKTIVLIKF